MRYHYGQRYAIYPARGRRGFFRANARGKSVALEWIAAATQDDAEKAHDEAQDHRPKATGEATSDGTDEETRANGERVRGR